MYAKQVDKKILINNICVAEYKLLIDTYLLHKMFHVKHFMIIKV